MTTLYSDDEAALMRYRFAPNASFDHAANWLYDGMGAAFKSGAARLAMHGANPAAAFERRSGQGRSGKSSCFKSLSAVLSRLITRHEINWTIVASATPAWAAAVFPDDPPDEALAKLWNAIFAISRVDGDDPVEAWKMHDANLHKRAAYLNEKRYSALQYRGPGTDFRLGLADDHLWLGRRYDGRERLLLHSQSSHGRSLHHSAQRSRGRHSDGQQATLVSGHDDRRDPGAL